MSKQAVLFPGQGAQLVGMGKDVADEFPIAAETFSQADEILGFALSRLCFDGPADVLANETDVQQPAIFVTSVALYRAALETSLIDPSQIVAMAGLSLGEYTALHLAGALSFEDALRLVHRRGTLMQEAARASGGGMVCLMGLSENEVLALCERVAPSGYLRPANFNCPGQIVVSGDQTACEAAAALADEAGGKVVPLAVAGAFHSDHMRPAANALRANLNATAFARPKLRVLANVDAQDHAAPDAIRESLYLQVFNPVRWQACVERLLADGVEEFWEVGPNRVLTGLMRKINRRAKITNVSKSADLTAAVTV